MEEKVDYTAPDFDIDETPMQEMPLQEVPKEEVKLRPSKPAKKAVSVEDDTLVSCLRNERVIVRHIPKEGGMVTNPKHILFGGMAENATRTFVVPRLSSGMFVNVLTDKEKAFLE